MLDDEDRRLIAHVRPPEWRNPRPKAKYDLVVIGGGTAGLVCAAGAAGLGAAVALVERARLGGDCLNTGCVPSKALLRSARVVGEARAGAAAGVAAETTPDFAAVMRRLRARRADIAPNDSAARLVSLGVDVFFGSAEFSGTRSIVVRRADAARRSHGGTETRTGDSPDADVLAFRKAVIATGSRPAVPPIAGLPAAAPFLTSDNVFDLRVQPRSLIVLGGGPVGCELAQAFARLGTAVTLVESAARLLRADDPDAAALVRASLERDGVAVRVGSSARHVSRNGDGVTVHLESGDVRGGELLVATGRSPNVEDLRLEAAGVRYGREGIVVDDRLRTSQAGIYASGDVCSRFKFTHAADALSRIVVQNALFFGRRRASGLTIPWCTFTAPEVAHVGMSASESAAAGGATITIPLADVDRSIVDDEREGFVRVHHARGRILGATIVASSAGELIGIVALAMQHGHGLAALASAIFPYPTVSLALRQAGDAYRRQSLTPAVRRVLHYYFRGVWR
jgi:pyruvate/2-oxoglutarate dehydrogenase complex dihydrolipoamide dehydrogenase (E3) component